MTKKRKILLFLLILSFITLAILVKLNYLNKFDTFFYNIVTHNMNDKLNNIHFLFTFMGSTIFIILLSVILVLLFFFLKKRNVSLIIAITIIGSTILNNIVKIIIRRSRPTVIALVTEKSFSFPSGHTMAATSLYGILLYLLIKSKINKKVKVPLYIILGVLPILVGISRIYLGAHFTSDIVGGMLLSSILLLIEIYYIEKKDLLV